jgi:hypothetical protein
MALRQVKCLTLLAAAEPTLADIHRAADCVPLPHLQPWLVFLHFLLLLAGDVRYRYIDLWSRATTWGGSLDNIPLEGDSVLVPAGTYVLLDVSPPQLDALVLEGTLAFDDSLPLGQVCGSAVL